MRSPSPPTPAAHFTCRPLAIQSGVRGHPPVVVRSAPRRPRRGYPRRSGARCPTPRVKTTHPRPEISQNVDANPAAPLAVVRCLLPAQQPTTSISMLSHFCSTLLRRRATTFFQRFCQGASWSLIHIHQTIASPCLHVQAWHQNPASTECSLRFDRLKTSKQHIYHRQNNQTYA